MRIHILAVGTRMPTWVDEAYHDYARRMPKECNLVLREISAARRTKGSSTQQQIDQEGERVLAAIPRNSIVVALDLRGCLWSTEKLASYLGCWLRSGQSLTLMIGGPDGLSESCFRRADDHWSLSPLTFPHQMVRIIVAEQLFRAWSMIHNHPYHRA